MDILYTWIDNLYLKYQGTKKITKIVDIEQLNSILNSKDKYSILYKECTLGFSNGNRFILNNKIVSYIKDGVLYPPNYVAWNLDAKYKAVNEYTYEECLELIKNGTIKSDRLLDLIQLGKECANAHCSRVGYKFLVIVVGNQCHVDLYTDDNVLMNIDHIYPKSKGGLNHIDNYQLMCVDCNTEKSNKILESLVNVDKEKFYISSSKKLNLTDLSDMLCFNDVDYKNGISYDKGEHSLSAHSRYNYVYELSVDKNDVFFLDNKNGLQYIKDIGKSDSNLNDVLFNSIIKNYMKDKNIYLLETHLRFNDLYITHIYLSKSIISGMKLIADKNDFDINNEPTVKKKFIHSNKEYVKNFMSKSGGNIPKKYINDFAEYKTNNKLVLYRGMSWDVMNLYMLDNVKSYPFKLNEDIKIKFNRANSWTTNKLVANDFTSDKPYSIIMEYIAESNDVVIDTRTIDDEDLQHLYYLSNQKEVILKPSTYKCKIIKISENGREVESGFSVDYKEIVNIHSEFNNFYKKLYSKARYNDIKYITKNKVILGDWAVEVPTIQVDKKGIIEIRYTEGRYKINLYNWKSSTYFNDHIFDSFDDCISKLKEFNFLYDLIARVYDIYT